MREQLACVAVLCAAAVQWEAEAARWMAPSRSFMGATLQPQGPIWQALGHDAVTWRGPLVGAAAAGECTWDWSWRELQGLPGIGPRRAALIVEARHFDAYARAAQGTALGGEAPVDVRQGAVGPRRRSDLGVPSNSSDPWRSMGPELLDLLPGIGPATVEALRLHWRAHQGSPARQGQAGLGAGRAAAPVEYTPPPARPP